MNTSRARRFTLTAAPLALAACAIAPSDDTRPDEPAAQTSQALFSLHDLECDMVKYDPIDASYYYGAVVALQEAINAGLITSVDDCKSQIDKGASLIPAPAGAVLGQIGGECACEDAALNWPNPSASHVEPQWGPHNSMGGNITGLGAALDQGGHVEAIVLGTESKVWGRQEPWTYGWQPLWTPFQTGTYAGPLSIAHNSPDTNGSKFLQVFALGTDGQIHSAVESATDPVASYGSFSTLTYAAGVRFVTPPGHDSVSRLAAHATQLEPELAVLKAKYAPELDRALRDAIAALEPRQRSLLLLHHGQGLSIDRLAAMYNVGRSTSARWLIQARGALLDAAKALLQQRLELGTRELESIVKVVSSELDVSLVRLLGSAG